MSRNFIIALVVVGVVGVGGAVSSPASALTVADLQAQIQEITARIKAMSAGGFVQSQNSVAIDPVNPAGNLRHRICAILYRNLAQGSRGDDVVSLQEFLRAEGHLSANATGYFGPLTAQAVARWQASQGVSAVGALGPVSRERIKVWCGGGWTNQERFSASPTRGEAPLEVTFSTWLSGFRVNTISYTIDFGDGSSERAADCPAPADACTGPGQNKHTYSSNGTYTATLNKITDPCPDDGDPNTPRCLAPVRSEVVGKAQIHVGTGPIACTKEYKPVCGQKQIVCITTPCNPIQQTYGNRCMMNADGATFLHEGVCRSDNNKPPVISGFSGPTTLAIDQTGTWSISASDPENGALSYRISWGDEQTMAPMTSFAAEAFVQTTTFTHAYNAQGTYTITVVVRDSAGLEARTTTSVKVAGAVSYCTADAMQCPDGTWVGRSGPNCQFVCPN